MESVDARAAAPPYRAAVAVFGGVFLVYLWTLAPSVTFWDAGEFIAAAKILGIPHPPGTPLFVVMANVWGSLVPIGEFAFRTNLLTALFSAAAAAAFFLLVAQALKGWATLREAEAPGREPEPYDRLFVIGGAAAAAVTAAFTFTVWQNSNETEVYMVAAFSIAAISWLAWLWRKHRGGERAAHILLLVVYLAAVSLGNHLLTLLVGPALIGFMWHVLRTEPLPDPLDRRTEWAQWAVVVGVWALLIGVGLGSTTLLVIGGIAFVLAAAYAMSAGAAVFAVTVLAIAAVGASTYLILLIRAQVGPFINEADPSTWESLWAVISREQYPPRSPIDNPIYTTRDTGFAERLGAFFACLPRFVDGPVPQDQAQFGIPECYTVRSIPLMLRQAQMYLQYFDWQWANGLAQGEPVFAPVRLPITLIFISLGVYGGYLLHGRDRSVFWLLVILFLTTGPGLVGYMNFRPGHSLAWDVYPTMDMHEVRERDYFFTISFQVWGMFVGLGLAGIYLWLKQRVATDAAGKPRRSRALGSVMFLAFLPLILNFRAASRAHGPEARLAADFAYDLLQTVEPYGIVFTNGDNDTFPLWYAQEVEGVRQDVSVVNLSLGNTPWYIRQLRDNPVRTFDAEQAPWFAHLAPEEPPPPLHTLSDSAIAGMQSMLLRQAVSFSAGNLTISYPENSPLYTYDMLILQLIHENWERRPIYFSMTAGTSNWSRFGDFITQHGLAFKLWFDEPPDATRLAPGLFGVPMEVAVTDSLLWHVYRYSDVMEADSVAYDATSRNIAINLSYPFFGLAWAYEQRGDTARSKENIRRGLKLHYLPEVARMLDSGVAIFQAPPALSDTQIGR
ncbi:MAG: DUF2723 domain-containing protein [Gemmatimonadales bacterium]|jgi:hypothetical protein